MIDPKVSRIIITMGIASVRAQCNELELQLATHSPECDKPKSLQESVPEKVVDLKKSKHKGGHHNGVSLAVVGAITAGLKNGELGKVLAERYGLSESAVSKIRKKVGLPPGGKWTVTKDGKSRKEVATRKDKVDPVKRDKELIEEALDRPAPPPPKDERQAVIDEVRQGFTWRKIRRLHPDVNYSTLWWWVEVERKQTRAIEERTPIIVTADPEANGSSGFCSCGSVIKHRLTQKYGGELVTVDVCGSCHHPVADCTCRKVLIPPVPLAVREGAKR